MELSEIIPHIEALIFASDRPLTSLDLVDLINNAFGFMEQQITLDQIDTALEGIREKYNSDFYPFEVFQSGGGWQFLSKPAFHTTIAQLNGGKFLKKLSNAALETLSIIAYKQPITKGEIESIRGVNSDYSVQKLLEKELIIISGRNEELPGKPLIYETSKSFMDYFGLNSADDLPKIKEVLAEQIEPTSQQRVTEENADFGIFSKLEGTNNATTAAVALSSDNDSELVESDTQDTTDKEGLADEQALAEELELSDQEARESVQEAEEDLNHELHPDLSDLDTNHAADSDLADELQEGENAAETEELDADLEDEQLADLEEDEEEIDDYDEDDDENDEEEDEDEIEEEDFVDEDDDDEETK